MIISLALMIVQIVALWKIFEKAGEKGWKSIIPIYNLYILFKMTKTKGFGLYIGTLLVGSILIGAGATMGVFTLYGYDNSYAVISTVFDIIGIIFLLGAIVLQIKMINRLCLSFGHGTGFIVLAIFVSIVAYPIMAFSSDEFILPEDRDGNKNVTVDPVVTEAPSEDAVDHVDAEPVTPVMEDDTVEDDTPAEDNKSIDTDEEPVENEIDVEE